MAQFDVHRNSGKHKDIIPFVVVVQSAQFDNYRRRVVVPLVRATAIGKVNYAAFNPTFKISEPRSCYIHSRSFPYPLIDSERWLPLLAMTAN